MPTLQEGLAAGGGETLHYVCDACNYRGMPLHFERDEDYREFREEHRGPPGSEVSAQEAARRSDAQAEAERDAAAQAPPLQVRRERGTLDRLRVMPVFAIALGSLALVMGGTGIAAVFANLDVLAPLQLAVAVLVLLVGVAFILVGARAWQRA